MSGVNTAGGVALSAPALATTAQLASLTSTINTVGKFNGRAAKNTDTKHMVWADGSTAAALWLNADGTTAHTPV